MHVAMNHTLHDHDAVCAAPPESSKGSPKVISPSRQLFSKVEIVPWYAFEWIYPLQHSGVVVGQAGTASGRMV